ncbi:hypothetical protein ACLOJK_030956 [Asimina triloba]
MVDVALWKEMVGAADFVWGRRAAHLYHASNLLQELNALGGHHVPAGSRCCWMLLAINLVGPICCPRSNGDDDDAAAVDLEWVLYCDR